MHKIRISQILMILLLFIPTFNFTIFSVNDTNRRYEEIRTPSPSSYWNLTGSRILIENNWSATASAYEWCSGSGTFNNPYIIENVMIDGLRNVSCITIMNSVVPFKIKNCVLYNAFSGIYLENVTNGVLLDNSCFNNSRGIICYEECKNISVVRNSLYRNYAGLSIYSNILTYIGNNNISENTEYAIEFADSVNTFIDGNDISRNYGKKGAIYEAVSENTTYLGNTIQSNYAGLLIEGSSNIVVTRNLFLKNTRGGLNATFCNLENLAFQNCFISNGNNAQDIGLSFYWDNGSMGNYWDDYTGKDSNEDGIGDSPYLIPGLPDVQDNYPLMSCPFYSSKKPIIFGYNMVTIIFFFVIFLVITIIYFKQKRVLL